MKYLIRILLGILLVTYILANFEFTNVKYTALDKTFADFEYCFLKSVNRSYKYMSLKVKLYKVPVTNVMARFQLLKKANGYKPFLYNFTFDACKYIRSPTKYPVIYFFHQSYLNYSNLNHTCPFDHDLIAEKVPVSHLNNMLSNILPMPRGEFAFFTTWSAYGIPRAEVNVYFKLT